MTKEERKARHHEFAALPATERREIVRQVNRGEPVTVRRHAPLAIAVAERQVRFWKYAWLLGPVLAVVQLLISDEPIVALSNGLLGTLVLGGFSYFWIRRAQRSVRANAAIAQRRIGPPTAAKPATHVPSEGKPRGRAPRGKKRRSR
ncbi:MAG: hypothetical protein WD011_03835 [Nitriliruptoraceae bacterium]